MYQILLVDDEAYFRQFLKSCIPWEENDYILCGEASSGEEALELLSLKPDIVLVDINMSGMNGLEFARQAKECLPSLQIIIITGFNEFEYAKKAVKIGVCNFISKPFDKQELLESLCTCKKSLELIQSNNELIKDLKNQIEDTAPLARDLLLYRMVSGWYVPEKLTELKENLKHQNLHLPTFPWVIITMESHLNLSEEQLMKELKIISNPQPVIFLHDQQVILILGMNENNCVEILTRRLQQCINELFLKYDGEISAGIGTEVSGYEQLKESYNASCIALRNKFLLGNNLAVSYSAMKIADQGEELYPFGLKNDLLMYARLLDWDNVCNTFDIIYNNIKNRSIHIDFIYILYAQLLSTCFSCLVEYDKKSEDVFGKDFRPFDRILSCKSLQEIHEFVLSVFHQAIFYLKDRKQAGAVNTVRKIKEYIDIHYTKCSLSIDEIAANVYFHPSYLRYLFKQEMGVTINEYLTKVRMEHAKELLSKGIYHHMRVASMVGYSDAAYFSKCFKKYYKLNPSDFEKTYHA